MNMQTKRSVLLRTTRRGAVVLAGFVAVAVMQASPTSALEPVDVEPPNLVPPADVTVEAPSDLSPGQTGIATATDNLDPFPVITFSDSAIQGVCSSMFTVLRSWTATDATGNSASAVQVISVVDTMPPVVIAPADVVVVVGDPTDPSATGVAIAFDEASGLIITWSDFVAGDSILRTWTATDDCGNLSQATQTITIVVVDSDGDGVLDTDDFCPGTSLTSDAPAQPKKNRYFVNADGQFVDGRGGLSGYTIADTLGCSSKQIIAAKELGRGHSKFGLSRGELRGWIAGDTAPSI